MTAATLDHPVVMAVNAIDSCGATGLAADIGTLAALGSHPAPVTTAVLARDTQSLKERYPIPRTLLIEQMRAVLEDSPVAAIKLGDTGDIANTEAIHTVLTDYPRLPLVFDPWWLPDEDPELKEVLLVLLLPRADLVVISAAQARAFSNAADTCAACAGELLERGCRQVLITGLNHDGGRQHHQLYSQHRPPHDFHWHCHPESLQGVGSTVSAAIASWLALGATPEQACRQALDYTCGAMQRSYRAGMGRPIPDRQPPR